MRVLFVVSECVPFVKSGGLGDVAGALPQALKKFGIDIRVMLPKYSIISEEFKAKMKRKVQFTVHVGWREQYCGIEELEYDGITYYFIDNEYYFKKDRLYGYYEDGERFAFFNRAVLESIPHIGFYPNIIHCHDWHTGMIPFLLREQYKYRYGYESIRTVFTIHNLQFQGIMPKETLGDLFGLSDFYFHMDALEFYGNINLMKAAIVASDKITTVSPTYRWEILTEYYGENLHGLLRKRAEDLVGILNGIDVKVYNPENDPYLYSTYSPANFKNKAINKEEIQKQFALPVQSETPLIVMISRLTKQKGFELVRGLFHEIMLEPLQLLILGTGDPEFEGFFRYMEHLYPNKFKAYIGFSEELAHRIYAAADIFLMPSKFEPCGLSQMIAMRYGAVPIVRETGGLNDTVQAYNEFTGEGNGFSFANFNAHDMLYTIRRAIHFYHDKNVWNKLIQRVMETDYSWDVSAQKYYELYSDLLKWR